jgi:tetratricopeptide (TPR) repeat protein
MPATSLLLAAAMLQDPGTGQPQQPVPATAESAQAFIARGLTLYKRLRFRAAAEQFEHAVNADPGSAAAHFYLGYTLYKIGEPTRRMNPEKQRSREEFAKAFELDPAFQPTWKAP